jgi:hypothetical protein
MPVLSVSDAASGDGPTIGQYDVEIASRKPVSSPDPLARIRSAQPDSVEAPGFQRLQVLVTLDGGVRFNIP